jgi:hypothetical protein
VLSLERMRRWGKMAAGFFPPCLFSSHFLLSFYSLAALL